MGVAADDQLRISASVGYDSNPYKLSSPEALQAGAEYKAVTFNYRGESHLQGNSKKANLRYRLDLQKDIYNHSNSAADNSRLDGRLRWIGRFKFGEQKANLMLSGDIRSERNTYYSQIQRQVAETSDGDLIDNRFCFDAANLSAELVYYADKKQSWSLLTQTGQRNYRQDYDNVGLESIDFNEFRLQPSFRYKTESGSNLRLFVYHKSRHYSDLQNDIDSDSSLVEYALNGYGAVFSKSLNKNLDSSFYLSGYFARDNGQGIRDLDYHKLTATLNYRLGSKANIEVIGQAYQRAYLSRQVSPEETETRSAGDRRTGMVLEIIYSQALSSESLRGLVSFRWETEHNSLGVLDYQRKILNVGLQYQL